jgi:hypothetical protein
MFDEIDPSKLFDKKKFATLIVTPEGIKKNQTVTDALIAITDVKISLMEREEFLKILKDNDSRPLLIQEIEVEKDPVKKAKLISVFWEIGLEATDRFLFFVEQACSDNYLVSLEAFTVIETIENEISQEDLKTAEKIVSAKIKEAPESLPLLEELLKFIQERIN